MRSTDFDLSRELTFDPDRGVLSYHHDRVLILAASAMGLLRHRLVERLGWEDAREVLYATGFQCGLADLMETRLACQFDTEEDLLAAGPVIHSWEGLVRARASRLRYDRTRGEFLFDGTWHNSFEAEQHLSYTTEADRPVCWMLSGYASGWCTGFFGSLVIAQETRCAGMGADHCEWRVQPSADWGPSAEPLVHALRDFMLPGAPRG